MAGSEIFQFITQLAKTNSWEKQYLEMLKQEADLLSDAINASNQWQDNLTFQRLALPERVISFNVAWIDDDNNIQLNQGWRVQHCSLMGPYKGGLRFHPDVDLSTLKALAYEQTFKNALTGFPIGGAKGGANFNPKGRTDSEILRFCQAFMNEFHRHIGPNRDIPAGDINVGTREIGYLFGQYRRVTNLFEGALTGKGLTFGGSHVREEATGYGVVYFTSAMMAEHNDELEGKRIAISGSGNVALHAAKKAQQIGGKVITLSNSRGTLVTEDGFRASQINWVKENRTAYDNPLKEAADRFKLTYLDKTNAWQQKCDVAIPCATQNELNRSDLEKLLSGGCQYISEGSNMALTPEAIEMALKSDIYVAPGKAANAGGVAMSALEMSQNAKFEPNSFDNLEDKLQQTMNAIFNSCKEFAEEHSDTGNYVKGASLAAFSKLSNAMIAQGV